MRTIKPYTKKGRPFIMRDIPALYVIHFKGALNSGESQLGPHFRIGLGHRFRPHNRWTRKPEICPIV